MAHSDPISSPWPSPPPSPDVDKSASSSWPSTPPFSGVNTAASYAALNPGFSSSEPDPVSSSDPDPLPSSSLSYSSHLISRAAQATFMDSLPADIKAKREADINKLFSDYEDKFIDTPNFELAMLKLIEAVPAALKAFKKLLPTANLIPSPTKKGRTVFIREPCTFNDRVRAGLYDDTFCYMRWLIHLIEYNMGAKTFREFKRNVEVEANFAKKLADLWIEFDAQFAPRSDDEKLDGPCADVEESVQDFSPGGSPSDATDQEPDSKRRKTD